jgi:hypothetical protein
MQRVYGSWHQAFDVLAALSCLTRLTVPTAFVLQDTTVDVASRGLCLLFYWLGVACVFFAERWVHEALTISDNATGLRSMVQETGFLVLCGIAALRSTARAQQPLVVLVLLAQVLHRQGAVWPTTLQNMTRAIQSVLHLIIIVIALAAAAQLRALYVVNSFGQNVETEAMDNRLFSAVGICFATGVLARDIQWVEKRKHLRSLNFIAVQMVLFLAHVGLSVLAVFQVLPFDALREPMQARHHGLSEDAASTLRMVLITLCTAILLAPLPRWSGSLMYSKLVAQAFVLVFFTLLASAASDETALLTAAVVQLALLRVW